MPQGSAAFRRTESTDRGGPILEAESLRFAYEQRTVLSVERFSVPNGTITAVIGPNGCGKTTLFKLLNGLLVPDSGTIRYDGRSTATPAGRSAIRSRSLYVHQKPYIFRDRVRDNITYGLAIRKVPRSEWETRVAESLTAVGITELAQRHGHALSGGERQRLAVARALALRPEVLFLDEPTSNIDPESVRIIESAVTNARRAGVTILLSTHNLATAYRIADVVLPMEAGRLRRDRNNVYHGAFEHTDASVGRFTFEGGQIVTPLLDGAFTAAVVPMDDVILSRRAVASSAQNAFVGRVTTTEHFEGLVRVGLDCGFPISALVTDGAIRQLGIAAGTEVHASFKASAVRLF